MNIYNNLPIPIQNILCNIYGLKEKNYRFGKIFKNEFLFLLESENFSEEEINIYQKTKLNNLIKHSYYNSKYYRNLISEFNSNLDLNMKLQDFPILTKDIIRSKFKLIKTSKKFQKKSRLVKTSGTTGSALSFICSQNSISSQWATWWRHRSRFGFFPGDWHINFTGKALVDSSQKNPPFWRIDYIRKQVLICSSQLTNKKIKYIIDFINLKKIKFITGYPSIVTHFCSLLESQNMNFDYRPKLVTLGAEKCHNFQSEIIKRVTGATVTDQYGFSEGCGNASKCSEGNYHIDWEMGHLECFNPKINNDGSRTGKILATGYKNFSFPFIRYLTGDYGTFAPDTYKCPCGNKSSVIFDIEGRIEDYVITSDGNKIMRFDYLFKETKGIKEAQIIQNEIDKIDINYVPNKFFTDTDIEKIRFICKKYINPNLIINFNNVDEVQRSSSGKFKAVISNL